MVMRNKIVWSDGLFMKPHHFQQQTRYMESLVRDSLTASTTTAFGVSRLRINDDLLQHGQISISAATGIMPDGTLFKFPEEDLSPPILNIAGDFVADEIIYLCLPSDTEGTQEIQNRYAEDDLQTPSSVGQKPRYRSDSITLRDNTAYTGELAEIEIARAQPFLARASEDLSAYTRLAILRIREKKPGGAIEIDERFIPTMISLSASSYLQQFLVELTSGLTQRSRLLAERLGSPDRSSVSDVTDFLLLQVFNRVGPVLNHYASEKISHPKDVYVFLCGVLGELSTYLQESRLSPPVPTYDHLHPSTCWGPLIQILRQVISVTLASNVIPIPYQKKLHGYYVAPLFEKELLKASSFILAVKSDLPHATLTQQFVAEAKISSIEKIRDLVSRQLPGIGLTVLPVAPRQLPFHAGYTYFELNKAGPTWQLIEASEGFAFHVPDKFPALEMQFWAIRGES